MKNKPYALYDLSVIRDLKDMIIKKVEQNPEKIAFSYSIKREGLVNKTYKNFWDDITAFGTWLHKNDMKGKHIAIMGENSYQWLVCFFAITCGGSVAVPLDKELPAKEISNLLSKSDAEVLIYSDSYNDVADDAIKMLVQEHDERQGFMSFKMSELEVFIRQGMELLAKGCNSYVDYEIDTEKMCCIMFTSGTSGCSKGVMLSQDNIVADINGGCRIFVLEGSTIAVLPFHHAFGLVVAVLMVIHYGQTIYINHSLKKLRKDLEIAKPQTMFLVPLFVETLHKQIFTTAAKDGKDKALRKLMKLSNILLKVGIDIRRTLFRSVLQAFGGKTEYIICGGAPLGTQYIKDFRSWGVEILNAYGTTECSPGVAVNRNYYHKDGAAGISIDGIQIKLGDDNEVMVKGPIVMMGYYKDTAATNEVLKDGWYYTGDLGYIDEGGFLTLTGRKKNLIILSNGENVSPEELEADFYRYEAVKEILVYGENQMIVAEIYPDTDYVTENVEEGKLQEYFDEICRKVNRNRPSYKQVGMIRLRDDEFPKNTSKKILRY